MDPKKIFDPGEMPMPLIDEAGDKFGHKLVDVLDFLAKKLGFAGVADLPEEVKVIGPTLIKLAGGGLTVRRDLVPIKGTLGDLVTKYLNTFVDSTSRGAAKGVKDAKSGEADRPKSGPSEDLLETKGYVLSGTWIPTGCTHQQRPKWVKDGDLITLREALERGHELHLKCLKASPEDKNALAAGNLPSAKDSGPEKEEKTMNRTEHPSNPATPVKTLGQLMAEYHRKDPVCAKALEDVMDVIEGKHPEIMEKFREVAPLMSVEDLPRFLNPDPAFWNRKLDDFRGGANPVRDGIFRMAAKAFGKVAGDVREGVASGMSEESEEFGGMLDGVKDAAQAGAMKLRATRNDWAYDLRKIGAENAPETERPKRPFPYVTFFCAAAFAACVVFALIH